MRNIRGNALAAIAVVLIALSATATSAQASTLQIQFTGLDLVYDGHDIFDATSPFGGVGAPSEADSLLSMDFLLDGALIGHLTSNIYVDIAMNGVGAPPIGGGARPAVPEPASILLLGAGLLGLAGFLRRAR